MSTRRLPNCFRIVTSDTGSERLAHSFIKMRFAAKIGVLGVLNAALAVVGAVAAVSQSYDGSLSYMLDKLPTPFYVPPLSKSGPVGIYEIQSSAAESLVPFTILVTNASSITSNTLEAALTSYLKDDVYSKSFLDGISHVSLGWLSYLQVI